MKIIFQHPPTGTKDPFKDFEPWNPRHYPKGGGVYIYGLKLKIDNLLKFVPLYVGISENLDKRLWQHYNEEKAGGNSKWHLFSYAGITSSTDLQNLYHDMQILSSKKGLNHSRFTNTLIWFNNASFFDFKLKLPAGTSNYISNTGVISSIIQSGDLDAIHFKNSICGANRLKSKIIESKALFDNNYYFVYSSLSENLIVNEYHPLFSDFEDYKATKKYMNGKKNGPGRKIAENIEMATKRKLETINIHTSAKAHGKLHEMEIFLSEIQNELVNVGNHSYNDSNGNYINPLIIL
jgi:hypothetical protein